MTRSNQYAPVGDCRHPNPVRAVSAVPARGRADVPPAGSSGRGVDAGGAPTHQRAAARNRGAVLVVGLIVLLVMVVLGISGMRTSLLQELMAGHTKDTNSSFQAAEAGMQAALTHLASLRNAPVLKKKGAAVNWTVSSGAPPPIWPGCEVQDADPDPDAPGTGAFDPCTTLSTVIANWSKYPDAPATTLGGQAMNNLSGAALPTVTAANQPHIVIESRYVPPLDFEEAARRKGFHYYTAAAVGFDYSTNARTILQTTITKKFY